MRGDKYALSGLSLSKDELELLVSDCERTGDLALGDSRLPCLDPEVQDSGARGAFFESSRYALDSMKKDLDDFRSFLAQYRE